MHVSRPSDLLHCIILHLLLKNKVLLKLTHTYKINFDFWNPLFSDFALAEMKIDIEVNFYLLT